MTIMVLALGFALAPDGLAAVLALQRMPAAAHLHATGDRAALRDLCGPRARRPSKTGCTHPGLGRLNLIPASRSP